MAGVKFISIHAPRTGSDCWTELHTSYFNISIHAPRTGSDGRPCVNAMYLLISIHAPRTGSDILGVLRRADAVHFNPRSPHGERPNVIAPAADDFCISIHAPRTGSDDFRPSMRSRAFWYFNPRSPHGERQSEI